MLSFYKSPGVFSDSRFLFPVQDDMAIAKGDKGPNTGGMGAYSPALVVTPQIEHQVMETMMANVKQWCSWNMERGTV